MRTRSSSKCLLPGNALGCLRRKASWSSLLINPTGSTWTKSSAKMDCTTSGRSSFSNQRCSTALTSCSIFCDWVCGCLCVRGDANEEIETATQTMEKTQNRAGIPCLLRPFEFPFILLRAPRQNQDQFKVADQRHENARLLHEVADEHGDLIRCGIYGEMASIDDVDFGLRHVAAVGFRL